MLTQIPLDVEVSKRVIYKENYSLLTRGSGKLFLFAADQKIEHLNDDFFGQGIDQNALSPYHIFRIAHQGSIGALATSAGLIARYAHEFPGINYIVKLNSKTNLVDPMQDPISTALWSVSDIIELRRNAQVPIIGVGYTIYLGSCHEHTMMQQAAQIVKAAHKEGLIVIFWVYPRAHHILNSCTPEIIAGACGLANALGADFVKVHAPLASQDLNSIQALQVATQAAGNTQVVCAGGSQTDISSLFSTIHSQIHVGGTAGCAIGRNIFQRSLPEAIALTRAISALVYEDASIDEAEKLARDSRK